MTFYIMIIIEFTFLRCEILDLTPDMPSPATKTISSSDVGVLFFYTLLKHFQLKIVALVSGDPEFCKCSLTRCTFYTVQVEKVH